MTITQFRSMTRTDIDQLLELLAVPDPQPAEPWEYVFANSERYLREGTLESIGHLHDLLAATPADHFLVVSKPSAPGVFAQAWNDGGRFLTECSVPNGVGNLIHQYTDGGRHLPLALAHLVMAGFVLRGGRLPDDWQGATPSTMQF